MFNVKRNGASVEITEIPASIPFSVFKNIADETGANECLVAYVKGKDSYEVVIRHDNVNMAATAAWLTLEAGKNKKPPIDDVCTFSKQEVIEFNSDIECAIRRLRGVMVKMKGPQLGAENIYKSKIETTLLTHDLLKGAQR
ncbi:hypothetical protein IQ454_004927 [Salmonella enterica]|nr:hypothetical protein [Salmonella enterica]EGL4360078.1 hypothetical protein [Salmonella enterica]EGL4383023.1 hypothetical protein [Salmonella enterica]EGL4488315.1 hypothetical protein [Salmonella enterica]EGL4515550.1 hypothetical protein [Salmonella enterica]